LRNFWNVLRNDNGVWCEQVVRRIDGRNDSIEGSGRYRVLSAESRSQCPEKRLLLEDEMRARSGASETHDRPCLPTSRQESRGRLPDRPG
jgi:hypothetical protein